MSCIKNAEDFCLVVDVQLVISQMGEEKRNNSYHHDADVMSVLLLFRVVGYLSSVNATCLVLRSYFLHQ